MEKERRTNPTLFDLISRPFRGLSPKEKAAMPIKKNIEPGSAQDLINYLIFHHLNGLENEHIRSLYGNTHQLANLKASPNMIEVQQVEGEKQTAESLSLVIGPDLSLSANQFAEIYVPEVRQGTVTNVPPYLKLLGKQPASSRQPGLESVLIENKTAIGIQALYEFYGDVDNSGTTHVALRLSELDIALPQDANQFNNQAMTYSSDQRSQLLPADHAISGWNNLYFVRYFVPDIQLGQASEQLLKADNVSRINEQIILFQHDPIYRESPPNAVDIASYPLVKLTNPNNNQVQLTVTPKVEGRGNLPKLLLPYYITASPDELEYFVKGNHQAN